MDPLQLLSDLEGLRDKIPSFLRDDFDGLIDSIRHTYEMSTTYVTPSQPVHDGKQSLLHHHIQISNLHTQIKNNLEPFQQIYTGQGSDGYHTTALASVQNLSTIRDHLADAYQYHDTMATNFDLATEAKIALVSLLIGLGVTLGILIFSGGTTAPATVPAAVLEVGGGTISIETLTSALTAASSALMSLLWSLLPDALLYAVGIDLVINAALNPPKSTSITLQPISITVISGGASQGGETVITNGGGIGADVGGWSTADQADFAWTAADACAVARKNYVDKTGNGRINYAIGFLSLDGSPMPPETTGPILGVGGQDTHSEQVIVNYWKKVRLPQLRPYVKRTGSNLVLMIFTRNQMCPSCNGMIPTWIQELAAAIGPGVTIHFYLWQSISPYNPPGPGNIEPVPGV